MELKEIKKNAEYFFKNNPEEEKVYACLDGNLFSDKFKNDAHVHAKANNIKCVVIAKNGDVIGLEEDKPEEETVLLTIDDEEKEYTAEELRKILDEKEVNYQKNTGLQKLAAKVMETLK
jgi:hypothetical protein